MQLSSARVVSNLSLVLPKGLQRLDKKIGFGNRFEIQCARFLQYSLCLLQRASIVLDGYFSQIDMAYDQLNARIEYLYSYQHELVMKNSSLSSVLSSYHELFDLAPIGQHTLTIEGSIIRVNKQWATILGYEEHEVCGKQIFDFLIPEQRENAKLRFEARVKGLAMPPKDGDRIYLAKDGSRIPAITFDAIIRDLNGRAIGIQTCFLNVSRLREVEYALSAARQQMIEEAKNVAVGKVTAGESIIMKSGRKTLVTASIGELLKKYKGTLAGI